jgi:nicotinamidase-related amidase
VKTCLLIIDVQNGFLSPKTSHVVLPIRDLIEQRLFDFLAFTRFINKPGSPHQRLLRWYKLVDKDEQFIAPQIIASAEVVFDKTTYSALTAEVLAFLRVNAVSRVFLCGIDTDCCVLITAADLFDSDIEAYVLSSYCASNGGLESHDAAIRILKRLIGSNRVVAGKIDQIFVDSFNSSGTT